MSICTLGMAQLSLYKVLYHKQFLKVFLLIINSCFYYIIMYQSFSCFIASKMVIFLLAADTTVMQSIDLMAFASSNNHDSTVTLQCKIGGFTPSHVSVHWLIGSRKENGQTMFVWEEGEEKSVKTHNYITVSTEEWRTGGACTCVVNLGGRMFNKTLHYYGK